MQQPPPVLATSEAKNTFLAVLEQTRHATQRYTPTMDLHLDAQSEQRIQREIDLGHYREPSEVIAHALTLLDAQEDWFQRNKEAINERLEASFAQAERSELYTPEEARALLAQDRQDRAKHLVR